MIGPLPKAQFRRGFARVRPGEVLVMCTDGILERRNRKGEFFGEDRLKQTVEEHRSEPAEAILEALFGRRALFRQGPAVGGLDATAVIVRRLAPARSA